MKVPVSPEFQSFTHWHTALLVDPEDETVTHALLGAGEDLPENALGGFEVFLTLVVVIHPDRERIHHIWTNDALFIHPDLMDNTMKKVNELIDEHLQGQN